jgi:hypothetical protein
VIAKDDSTFSVNVDFFKMQKFIECSGDANPLHFDIAYSRATPFGEPVCHGVLFFMICLAKIRSKLQSFEIVDIQSIFYQAVFPDINYSLELSATLDNNVISWKVYDGAILIMSASISLGLPVTYSPRVEDMSEQGVWSKVVAEDFDLVQMAVVDYKGNYFPDWQKLTEVVGIYPRKVGLSKVMTAALCGVSYVIGMEIPGRQAMLRSFRLRSTAVKKVTMSNPFLKYEARISEPNGLRRGLAKVVIEFTEPDGALLRADVTALVRQLTTSDIARIHSIDLNSLKGMTSVITGGSRGFGHALSLELQRRGCRVFSTSRFPQVNSAIERLTNHAVDCTDLAAIEELLNEVHKEGRKVDLLILNATNALHPMWIDKAHLNRILNYLQDEILLALTPFVVLANELDGNKGLCIFVSSSYLHGLDNSKVEYNEPVKSKWPHYLAAKTSIETLINVASAEYEGLVAWIRRMPEMDTSLINQLSGAKYLSTTQAAYEMVEDIEAYWIEKTNQDGKKN